MRCLVWVVMAIACCFSVGCASVTQGSTHSLRIDTETDKGDVIAGAPCDLITELGTIRVLSGQGTQVKRSGRDLEITCTSPGQPPASAKLVSRANAGLAGNIIIGGGIGALVDHNTGSAYTYPSWVRLVFGEYAVFDRKEEKDGYAMAAKPGSATKINAVPAAPASTPVMASSPPAAAVGVPGAGVTEGLRVATSAPDAAVKETRAGAWTLPMRPGDAFDYLQVDHMTGKRQTITYKVDRVSDDRIQFNAGALVTRANGDLVEASAPIALELDAATPPGGWTRNGKVQQGVTEYKFMKRAGGNEYRFEFLATTSVEGRITIPVGQVNAVRIDIEGWTSRIASSVASSPVMARYRATVWYSHELQRVVRFTAATRTGGGAGGGSFAVDETLELAQIGRN